MKSSAKTINGGLFNFFIGIFRRGSVYIPPNNFETSTDELRRWAREFKERQKVERKVEHKKDLRFGFLRLDGFKGSSDLTFILSTRTLVLPLMGENKVVAYKVWSFQQ